MPRDPAQAACSALDEVHAVRRRAFGVEDVVQACDESKNAPIPWMPIIIVLSLPTLANSGGAARQRVVAGMLARLLTSISVPDRRFGDGMFMIRPWPEPRPVLPPPEFATVEATT